MSFINKVYSGHLITDKSIIVSFTSGPPININYTNSLFQTLKQTLQNKEFDRVPGLADRATKVTVVSRGKFNVQNGTVVIDGEDLPHALSEKLLELVDLGKPTQYLENFWDNLKDNPTESSRADLFEFLTHNSVPITPDGCFIVYKKVDNDFMDFYTHTIRNKPGDVVEVARDSVDPLRDNVCSHGLHVAAFKYANEDYHGGQGKLLEIKVNPRDVVAVPPDYNAQKMRVCRYTVIKEVKNKFDGSTYEEPTENTVATPVRKSMKRLEITTDSEGRLRIPGKAVRLLDVGVGFKVFVYQPHKQSKHIRIMVSQPAVSHKFREYTVREDNSVRVSSDILQEISCSDTWSVSLINNGTELRLTPA